MSMVMAIQDLVRKLWKERAVEETKERIKQRRQLKSIKEIYHRQSLQKVRKLQKFHSLVLQYKSENSKIDTGDVQSQYTMERAIQLGLEEVSRLARVVAIDRAQFSGDQFVDNRVMLHLYWHLNQLRGNGGVDRFLSLIKGSKQQHLSQLQSVIRDGVWSDELTVLDTGTTELLQLFREHHIERVVQIESVCNKFAAYEQERDELYAKMRFQAQRRSNEKRHGSFLQELEETKAHLRGLETALAFIQMEQEIMVERVQSVQVHQSGLEVMSRASRVADQQMFQLQQATVRLIAMLKHCHESIPTISSDIACGITRSITEGLTQLSGLVQNLESRTEYDATDLQACAEESQQQYANSHIRVIQTPALDGLYLNITQGGTSIDRHPQELLGGSSLSSDSHILQVTGFHRHELLQTIAASTARELRECMEAAKNDTVSKMKASVPDIYMGTGLSKDEVHREQRAMNIESLTSRFESDAMDIVRSIVDHEVAHQDKFLEMIQSAFKGVQTGFGVAQDIQAIIMDNDRISSLLPRSKDHGSILHHRKEVDYKRVRYMR
ncbi:hypothetical protein BG011_001904 [Mortierella polycephala]|uniref:Uncharacterized protein n=1 Tax=Mortierella polycephala TaxID=41804 RepID=A0A9P6U4P3_9FUNG|nr:hypothetical protein BG011_001904 [Mortierella polycephala]